MVWRVTSRGLAWPGLHASGPVRSRRRVDGPTAEDGSGLARGEGSDSDGTDMSLVQLSISLGAKRCSGYAAGEATHVRRARAHKQQTSGKV